MIGKPSPRGNRIEAGAVILRPVEAADAELLRRWRNRDDVRTWFGDTETISTDSQKAWMLRYLKKNDDAMFVIVLAGKGEAKLPAGAVALYDIDRECGTAEYGRVMIGEDAARGKAVAERASRALCKWAFAEVGLQHIVLWVMRTNHRAIAIYERVGFVQSDPAEERDGYLFMTLEKNDLR